VARRAGRADFSTSIAEQQEDGNDRIRAGAIMVCSTGW